MTVASNVLPEALSSLRESINTRVPSGTTLLGSQLGGLIAPNLKPSRILDFGGLKRFVEEYLPNEVQWIGRTDDVPGDDIYLVGSSSFHNLAWKKLDGGTPGRLFWRGFSNPHAAVRLALTPERDSIYYCEGAADVPADWIEIPTVSEDDYRSMAREFSVQLPEAIRPKANEIVDKANFNVEWVRLLKQEYGSLFLRQWETTRVSRVVERLDEVLAAIGVAEDLRSGASLWLQKSRSPSPDYLPCPRAKSEGTGIPRVAGDQVVPKEDLDRLRRIVSAAAQRMTVAELRDLRIPLGIVLDLLRPH